MRQQKIKSHLRISTTYSKALEFSPIYINYNLLSAPQLIALYKYISLFFPQLIPTLQDMEKNAVRLKEALSEFEMKKLIRELKNMKVRITASIEDVKQGQILSIPLDIRPALVLENVMQGKPLATVENGELREIFIPLVRKELKRRLTEVAEGYFKLELAKAEISIEVQELLEQGLITSGGKFAEKVAVDDLISQRYVRVFKRINIQELVDRGFIKK